MTDEQRQEIMRLQAEGMRAMSKEEMARRQLESAKGMRPRGPLKSGEQEAMRNFWGRPDDPGACFIPEKPPQTLWARFSSWIRA